jgi:hypothetical protein
MLILPEKQSLWTLFQAIGGFTPAREPNAQ